jgi:hypothetical protein
MSWSLFQSNAQGINHFSSHCYTLAYSLGDRTGRLKLSQPAAQGRWLVTQYIGNTRAKTDLKLVVPLLMELNMNLRLAHGVS